MKTVYVLYPVSKEAREWVKNNVNYESYQVIGEGAVIEHRYIGPIVEAMVEKGFEVGKDFEVE